MKKINRFEIVYEQYRKLGEKLSLTSDIREKNLLFRRMINLLNFRRRAFGRNCVKLCRVSVPPRPKVPFWP